MVVLLLEIYVRHGVSLDAEGAERFSFATRIDRGKSSRTFDETTPTDDQRVSRTTEEIVGRISENQTSSGETERPFSQSKFEKVLGPSVRRRLVVEKVRRMFRIGASSEGKLRTSE